MIIHIPLDRFETLRIDGKEVLCPRYNKEFTITRESTTGGGLPLDDGGHSTIGVECPHCNAKFGMNLKNEE